jgi:hypothetical protein
MASFLDRLLALLVNIKTIQKGFSRTITLANLALSSATVGKSFITLTSGQPAWPSLAELSLPWPVLWRCQWRLSKPERTLNIRVRHLDR